jgi:hypothetical protein
MPRLLLALLASFSMTAVACGGPPRAQSARDQDEEEDEDDTIDEEEDDEDDEEGEGFVDQALLRGQMPRLTLGEPAELPGTGVTLRPPEGSTPMPFGSGFISMRHRVQISVVVVVGPESLLDAVRSGGQAQAPEPAHVENVTAGGQSGRLGRDRVATPNGELERIWLLVHDGQRGLAVVGTYEASRAAQLRDGLRESFLAVAWNRQAALDASLALGIEVGPVEGLTPSRTTTANIVLLGRGATFPPTPGQPVVTISSLPMQLASDRSDRVCAQLVARLLPVPTTDIEHEGTIENGPLPGCERLATAENDEHRLAAYAALLFHEGTPLLVTGSVDARQLARWRPRFANAARAVRPRRQAATH